MYYEINVSRKLPDFQRGSGFKQQHFFATAPKSLITMRETQEAVDIFKKKFPKKQGYSISVTRYEEMGTGVSDVFGIKEAEWEGFDLK